MSEAQLNKIQADVSYGAVMPLTRSLTHSLFYQSLHYSHIHSHFSCCVVLCCVCSAQSSRRSLQYTSRRSPLPPHATSKSSLTHSLIDFLFIHRPSHSLTHSLTHSLISHSYIDPPTHSLTHSFVLYRIVSQILKTPDPFCSKGGSTPNPWLSSAPSGDGGCCVVS
jgi:hypothetical protein